MNNDIRQLINQVGTDISGKWIAVDKVDKLAELIVKECARVAFATAIGDGSPDEIHDAIKETFRS